MKPSTKLAQATKLAQIPLTLQMRRMYPIATSPLRAFKKWGVGGLLFLPFAPPLYDVCAPFAHSARSRF